MLNKEQLKFVKRIEEQLSEREDKTFQISFINNLGGDLVDLDGTVNTFLQLGVLIKISPRKYALDSKVVDSLGGLSSKQQRWMDILTEHIPLNSEFMTTDVNKHIEDYDDQEWTLEVLDELINLGYVEKISPRKYKFIKHHEDDDNADDRFPPRTQISSVSCVCGAEVVQTLQAVYLNKLPEFLELVCSDCGRQYRYTKGSDVYQLIVRHFKTCQTGQ